MAMIYVSEDFNRKSDNAFDVYFTYDLDEAVRESAKCLAHLTPYEQEFHGITIRGYEFDDVDVSKDAKSEFIRITDNLVWYPDPTYFNPFFN